MQSDLSRRQFLQTCAACGLGLAVGAPLAYARREAPTTWPVASLKEAFFWEALADGRTHCMTCPNGCVSEEGGITRCRTRINRGGKLYTMTYGKPCVIYMDPL
ncbi:MAG: twin-arginine translocation signal domain-containing protein, partial [Verrucomicrobia bacterium]|nr:twin-arginine translocation signal domain-containing protein [Verrucomicrobiota bacterium]